MAWRIPFIGRLFWHEYIALFGSLIIIFLEGFIRIITLALPQSVINFCYNRSKNAYNWLCSSQQRQSRPRKEPMVTSIANSPDFVDLCALYGYHAEEHIVKTGDGYLLGLHRLCWRKGEEAVRINAGTGSMAKRACYLHHGLLMNSEVWVCMTEEERCLPFALVDKGYDVWLGNNRGNKYSKKSSRFSPASIDFWDFSMDQFAFHDIPDSIDYILDTTHQLSLSYVGFSQGTAQAFAALSTHPTLNDKIDVFVALAPAMSPAGLRNGVVDALMKASPEFLFLAFGRRSILSSAMMWQSILYPPIFVRILDTSLSFLFNWTGKNISAEQKLAAYPHLYSFTSTKSVVHWFQIIRNKSFQMYDDDVQAPLSIGASDRYYKAAKFPTRNIATKIVLIYGGSDSLVDIRVMLRELPRHTVAKEIPHFEHLDFLWAQDVDTLVFPHVFEALNVYAGRDHLKSTELARQSPRYRRLAITDDSKYPDDDLSSPSSSEIGGGTPSSMRDREMTTDSSGNSSSAVMFRGGQIQDTRGNCTAGRSNYLASMLKKNGKHNRKRSGSMSSTRSFDSNGKVGEGGIDVGPGRATAGVSNVGPPSSHSGKINGFKR